ncbi:MAG: hypothetical protein KatS3mg112_1003 [Thermogutta sp.]|nr:MAG: hypothetical protein KatS3mg112_1003 [Thermogutta sp.]
MSSRTLLVVHPMENLRKLCPSILDRKSAGSRAAGEKIMNMYHTGFAVQ